MDVTNNYHEWLNGTDPNKIVFTLGFTNQFVSTSNTVVTACVSNGVPSSYAVLVDSTNTAGASWTGYSSSNLTVSLGSTEGWHDVRIGLRGRLTTSQQTWLRRRVKYDHTPPVLVFTNPVSSPVNQPMIELQGYSAEALSAISYDLTNTNGVATNQQVLVLSQFYDTNTWETTTNYFQAFDVPLTVGTNAFTVHATDLAGNVTTTNLSYVLDYSSRTNPPVITLYWPQDGAQISGSNFTWRGQLDDFTDQLTVQTVDINGNTNMFNGLVERNGNFWVEDLPLTAGTNALTLMAVDAVGNTNQTNISVVQSTVNLTMDPVSRTNSTVTGTIDSTNYIVWVNGVKATNIGGDAWSATNIPMVTAGTAIIQTRAISLSDNGGNGNGGGGGTNTSLADPGNPDPPDPVEVEKRADMPIGIYFQAYTSGMYEEFYVFDFPPTYKNVDSDYTSWENGVGGMATRYYDWDGFLTPWTDQFFWMASHWPQPVPAAEMWDGTAWQIGSFENSALGTNMMFGDVPTSVYATASIDGSTYFYQYGVNRQAQMSLSTGGKADTGTQSLFELSLSVDHLSPPQGLVLGPPDQNLIHETFTNLQQVMIGKLGHLGADGKLWVVLPDGANVDVMPHIPGLDYYQFAFATPIKHKLIIVANGEPLAANHVKPLAKYCVGEYMSFTPTWSPPLPTGATKNPIQWAFGGTFVNHVYDAYDDYPNNSMIYDVDSSLLLNETTSAWWVSGGFNPPLTYRATVAEGLTLPNGQYVAIAARGQFSMFRPQITNFHTNTNYHAALVPTDSPIKLRLGGEDNTGIMDYRIAVQSAAPFSGSYNITQLINANRALQWPGGGSQQTTDGAFWADNGRFYFENDVRVDPDLYIASQEFSDAPAYGLNRPFASLCSIVDSFQDFIIFRPDGDSNNIYVTLGRVFWSWSASTSNTAGVWSNPTFYAPGPTKPDNSNQFPVWSETLYNAGGG